MPKKIGLSVSLYLLLSGIIEMYFENFEMKIAPGSAPAYFKAWTYTNFSSCYTVSSSEI